MTSDSRIGLYGGTFDPVHIAHLILAEWVRYELSLDHILFMPCAIPPHKQDVPTTPGHHRLTMLRLATRHHQGFTTSAYEIKKGGTSYTIDTIESLKQRHYLSRDRFFLLIGGDNLADFASWKDPDRIVDTAQIVAMKRPYYDLPIETSPLLSDCIEVETPLLQVSSSMIRQRLQNRQSIHYLVPDPVRAYIEQEHLYSQGAPMS